VIVMWKIVGDMLETHPLSFVPFLQGGLEFAVYFGFSDEAQILVFERVPIHAFNLLKGILLCPEFRAPKRLSLDGQEEIVLPGNIIFPSHHIYNRKIPNSDKTHILHKTLSNFFFRTTNEFSRHNARSGSTDVPSS